MSVALLTDQTIVQLYPLQIEEEKDGAREVGRPETGNFIGLPSEGVEIIRWLQAGLTLGEIKDLFNDYFGQEPDLSDFIKELTECGFVQAVHGEDIPPIEDTTAPEVLSTVATSAAPSTTRLRLYANVPTERLLWLRSIPLQSFYLAIWIATPTLLLLHPLLPTTESALILPGVLANTLVLILASYALIFLHQCAHVFVAKAYSCPGTLDISIDQRIPSLQANIPALQTLPRHLRYGPYLAGITWDMVLLLICTMLRIQHRGGAAPVACSYLLLTGLLLQCAFFVRTDIYAVISNWLQLDTLMQHTQHWLVNSIMLALRRDQRYDLSTLTVCQQRDIRRYAYCYLLGILITVSNLLLIVLPLLAQYVRQALTELHKGPLQLAFWDGAGSLMLLALSILLLLASMWHNGHSTHT